MRNGIIQHKKNGSVKWLLISVTLMLFAVLFVGICLRIFGTGSAPTRQAVITASDKESFNASIEISPLGFVVGEAGTEGDSSSSVSIVGPPTEEEPTPPPTTKYLVTYDSAGGTPIPSENVTYGASASAPIPTLKGFSFVGWYKSDGTKYMGEGIKSDTLLVAHWDVQMLNVTFYDGNTVYLQLQVEYGTILSAVVSQNIPANYIAPITWDKSFDTPIKRNCVVYIKPIKSSDNSAVVIVSVIAISILVAVAIIVILTVIGKRKKLKPNERY